ncbi:MAG: class I SAM-dependent methyltransferase [Candidatus Bathyarchaeia archaeon]
MRNLKAEMFNKKAADPKNKPNEIIEALGLQQGQKVADIGAGGGYFALRFAEAVGKDGRVFAVDTNPKFLEYIRHCAKRNGFENIETIFAAEDAPNLPDKSIDLIFMRNVCHHLTNRMEYFKKLKNALKSNGRIAIIEYSSSGGRFSFHRKFGHYVPKEIIMAEMEEAGYKLMNDLDFLLEQSFMIFSLADK